MYIFKNALVSIIRNKGRNLLIGLIILIIALSTAVTLAIRNSASSLIKSYQNQYDVLATIGINRKSMRKEMKFDKDMTSDDRESMKNNMSDIFSTVSNITKEEIKNYADSEYVKDYYYQISVGVNSPDLEKASMNSGIDNNEAEFGGGRGPKGREDFLNISSSDFTLVGYSSLNGMSEFISGKYSITNGEVFSNLESNDCVINSELATLNDIKVGDEVVFADPDNSDNTITLKVVGIFDEVSDNDEMMGMFTSSVNMIITNYNSVEKLVNANSDINKTITPTFVLISSDVVSNFSSEVKDKGLSEYLNVSTNLDQVSSSTSTISNVYTFATTFLIITLIIGGVILFVINMINIRERKYEIGVLRTIGMKKSLLTSQFILELLMVTVIFLSIGAFIGSVVSVPVSNQLLKSEISASEEKKNNIGENFGRGMDKDRREFNNMNGIIKLQEVSSIDAVVDIKVLGELFVIGIVLVLISSSVSMISIQKFSPLTILKERS